jgi:hypothetical protein
MVFEPWNPHLQKYGAYALDEYQSQTLKIKRFMIFLPGDIAPQSM